MSFYKQAIDTRYDKTMIDCFYLK